MQNLLKKVIYKSYVLLLIALVIWVAQFIYPLIFWEFEHTGNVSARVLTGNETILERMRKTRAHHDKGGQVNKIDLSDLKFEEDYIDKHFHHIGARMDTSVINGCDYCHTSMPHQKDKEVRAFLNMHNYFLACETCHFDPGKDQEDIAYRWIKNDSLDAIKRPIELLKDELVTGVDNGVIRGNYNARIIPWLKKSDDALSIINLSDIDDARDLLDSAAEITEQGRKARLNIMHNKVTDKPLACDACHTEKDNAFSYADLGYPQVRVRQLMDTAIAGMISKYKQFHFPNLFIRKEDREKDFTKE